MAASDQKTYLFHVNGMHCAACVMLIEDAIKELPNVAYAQASLTQHQVSVTGEFDGSPEQIAAELTTLVHKNGYTLSVEKNARQVRWEPSVGP